MPDFLLPDLGEGLEEAEVVAWHVRPGDQVSVDQIVVEVETAKAAVDVPVPFAGIVATLHADPGTTVKVGHPLITISAATSPDTVAVGFHEPGTVTPTPAEMNEDSGNVLIGYGTGSASSARRRKRGAPDRLGKRAGPSSSAQVVEDSRPSQPGEAPSQPTPTVGVVSPIVRGMARKAGLDLTTITGTGPAGIIRRSDVERALAPAPAQPGLGDTGTEAAAPPGGTRIPLRGLRRTVADKLSRSRREIPEATVWVDVDVTDLLAARRVMNADSPEQPVGVLALLARFTLLALSRYPVMNARIDNDEIIIPDVVHLGIAAQTDRGLVVPVIRDAQCMSTRVLSAAITERTAAARAGDLSPGDMTGGTITVNNYGVFGVDGSAAIINHPEVAIVGMGRIIDRPWVVDGELAVRKLSQLTLAFDHRVCDGGTAGGFLRYLADCLENPVRALGDL